MTKFNQFLSENLNKPQLKAVSHDKGPLIVIAGAGSGKTRVITSRMAHLIINKNVTPESIVALTFTNKAANEMKERILSFLDNNQSLPFVGTFHSYCLLILRSNPTLLKFPKFSILDSDDQKSLVKKIIKSYGLEKQFTTTELIYQISNLKNKINPDFESFTAPIIKEIYMEYESQKAASHSFDFDDLMLEVLKIFKTNKQFRLNFQKRVRHMLVDEYQDTNMVQHELLKMMGLDEKKRFNLDSLCAVGDEDQSIYSWRGAVPDNMQNFQQDFGPVELIKIEQNYRTVQPILKAANQIIKKNRNRTNKKLWSEKKADNRILCLSCRSGKQEAMTIANFINTLPKDKPLNEIAILFRTHYQSRQIEESLIYNSIAYKIVGGIRFYERKEIKDLLGYLRLILNPHDKVSLLRVINCPNRGLGTKFEQMIMEEARKNSMLDFKQLLNYILNEPEFNLTSAKKQAVTSFLKLYTKIETLNKPSDQIEEIIDNIEYFSYLKKQYDEREAETKIENVKEFIQSIYNFEKDFFNSKETYQNDNLLEEFLYQVSLMQEKTEDKENQEEQVQCMTLHAAKGLEFDTVIIVGMEEGLLPSSRALNTNKELEEERRLFYVGITRAKERLILSHAYYRNSYGQLSDQVISRFLTEVPEELIQTADVSEQSFAQAKFMLKSWLGVKSDNVLTFHDFANKLAKNMDFQPNQKHPKLKSNSNKISSKKTTFKKRCFKSKEQSSLETFNSQIKQKYNQFKKPTLNSKSNKNDIKSSLASTPTSFSSSDGIWRRNQLVSHTKFGVGLIKKAEKKDTENYYLTIAFKSGEKKILSSFLKKI